MKKKVLVGMSGGVDSSAAAFLLKQQGYDVTGATMRLWAYGNGGGNYISSVSDDAARVCDRLGIDFISLDFEKEFINDVVNYFISEYKNGRTPNPCVMCNRKLKFGAMLDKALNMGFDAVATGHYANIGFDGGTNRFTLKKGADPVKDQTYFLYHLTQQQLSRTLMPLGSYQKSEIRTIAEKLSLPSAAKPDSQEICFIRNGGYADFITEYTSYTPKPGKIIDVNGNILGTHKGILYYTIGQRKGIGAYGRPMFVKEINPQDNTVTLGEKGMEFSGSLVASDPSFIPFDSLTAPIRAEVKVRYGAKPAPASVEPLPNGEVKVVFDALQRAVTPGQAVVFYDGDYVIGGATVKR